MGSMDELVMKLLSEIDILTTPAGSSLHRGEALLGFFVEFVDAYKFKMLLVMSQLDKKENVQ